MKTDEPRTPRATPARVLREVRRQHFVVLSTAGPDGAPHAAGVNYGSSRAGEPLTLYVMTRRHLRKARDIAADPRVALVIPVPRPALPFLPPATIQLRGRAQLLDWDDAAGTRVFASFWMGRRILQGYRRARERGESRVCFVRIAPDPKAHTYLVGSRIWEARRNMEAAAADVRLDAGA